MIKEKVPAASDSNQDNSNESGNIVNKPISKVSALDIPEIAKKIIAVRYHVHEDRPVPEQSLELWKKRKYNPNKIGVIHVRYPGIRKKYVFPLYFWVVRQ